MELNSDEQRRMQRYLLGELSAPEKEELEQQYFQDPDCLERLQVVEDDLIDSYLTGELVQDQRLRFEEQYLGNPARRKKVDFARALLVPRPARLRTWMPYGLAAAVLLAALGVLLIRLAPDRRPQPARPARPSVVASFSLTPLLARDTGSGFELSIPPGATDVRLLLSVDSSRTYSSYRAALHTVEGSEIRRWEPPEAQSLDAGSSVALQLPAALLPAGDYILTLEGLGPGGAFEKLPSYTFRVLRSD